jgi:uncharacterized protein YjiK
MPSQEAAATTNGSGMKTPQFAINEASLLRFESIEEPMLVLEQEVLAIPEMSRHGDGSKLLLAAEVNLTN